MKTPLGTEVDLGPGHIVLDGVQLSAKGAQQPPSFRHMSIVATVTHLSYCMSSCTNLSIYQSSVTQKCSVPIYHWYRQETVNNSLLFIATLSSHLQPWWSHSCLFETEKILWLYIVCDSTSVALPVRYSQSARLCTTRIQWEVAQHESWGPLNRGGPLRPQGLLGLTDGPVFRLPFVKLWHRRYACGQYFCLFVLFSAIDLLTY